MSSDPAGGPEPGAMVLVTGASGFVGLNLLHVLVSDRRPVVGLADRPLPDLAAASLAHLGPVPVVDQVDVRDTVAVAEAVGRHQPGVVIHAAAVTAGPDRERTDARTVVDVNVGGTQSVLDACSQAGVKRLVHVSSGAVYGSASFGPEPLDETTLVAPASPPPSYYGITKLAAEQLARRHGQLHDLDVVAARLSA
ncbi:MAG: NAD(P)-dependent oxidoreductase, partial [Acidimicrobiia bacterium]|nr:NAD(P)-dependent oxidoreductase [Acidimicrobiia bacterium]